MKCAFCTIGSRGDLQPLVALALAFREKGWEVLVISEERNRALAEEFQLEFRAVAGDSAGIIFEEEYAEMLAKGKLMAMMQEIHGIIRHPCHDTRIPLMSMPCVDVSSCFGFPKQLAARGSTVFQ